MVIEIRTNAKDVVHSLSSIRLKLQKSQKKTLEFIAIQGKNIAKSLAPQKSGNLKRGIFHKSFKDRAEIISVVNTSFPYHLWVNADPSFDVLNFTSSSHQPFFKVPQKVRYGLGALSPSGNPIRWTGVRGYFNETAELLRARYGEIFDIEVGKVLLRR